MIKSLLTPRKLLAQAIAAVAIAVFWCITAVGTTVGATVGVTTLATAVTAATSTSASAYYRGRGRGTWPWSSSTLAGRCLVVVVGPSSA